MALGDYIFALEFKDILTRLVREEVERQRPRYRMAVVVSFDRVTRKCEVEFPDDSTTAVINMGSIQPATVGQVVRVAGLSGDRYIDDVLGDAYRPIDPDPPLARGLIGIDRSTATSSSSSSTTPISILDIVVDVPEGRNIKVEIQGRMQSTVAGDRGAILIYDGSTEIQGTSNIILTAANTAYHCSLTAWQTPASAGTHTYNFMMYRSGGSGAVSMYHTASGDSPFWIAVTDMGPTSETNIE